MNDTTFTFDSKCGHFQVTVKKSFLEKCADPANTEMHKLMTELHLGQMLHNPYGPALARYKRGVTPKEIDYKEYWIEGKRVSEEVAAKIQHSSDFNTELDVLLK